MLRIRRELPAGFASGWVEPGIMNVLRNKALDAFMVIMQKYGFYDSPVHDPHQTTELRMELHAIFRGRSRIRAQGASGPIRSAAVCFHTGGSAHL